MHFACIFLAAFVAQSLYLVQCATTQVNVTRTVSGNSSVVVVKEATTVETPTTTEQEDTTAAQSSSSVNTKSPAVTTTDGPTVYAIPWSFTITESRTGNNRLPDKNSPEYQAFLASLSADLRSAFQKAVGQPINNITIQNVKKDDDDKEREIAGVVYTTKDIDSDDLQRSFKQVVRDQQSRIAGYPVDVDSVDLDREYAVDWAFPVWGIILIVLAALLLLGLLIGALVLCCRPRRKYLHTTVERPTVTPVPVVMPTATYVAPANTTYVASTTPTFVSPTTRTYATTTTSVY